MAGDCFVKSRVFSPRNGREEARLACGSLLERLAERGGGAGAAARRRSGQYLQHWCFQPFLPQSRFQVPCGGAVGAEEPGSCVCFEEDGGGLEGALFIQGVGSDAVNYSLMCGGKEL